MSASPSTHLIAEDLLLLLRDDRKGTIAGSYTRTALGGAVLVELALAEGDWAAKAVKDAVAGSS